MITIGETIWKDLAINNLIIKIMQKQHIDMS